MKTRPIVPAEVDFADAGVPRAPAFGDVYHARQGAFPQARHVFLGGNGLPGRWAGRARFVVLETGFGLGNNFLATWAAWRDDPAACERLVFVSVEKHPLRAHDLRRAHAASAVPDLAAALCDAWPPLTPGLHRLAFEGGRVELLLGLGDVHDLLPALVADVDAFFLDGFAPDRNAAMWDERVFRAVARLAAPGATAATWSAAAVVREGLRRAGFAVEKAPGSGGKRDITVARLALHPKAEASAASRRPPFRARGALPRRVAVIGAGLAGAFAARALASEGLEVVVLDAEVSPASAASGNPAGLFHGVVHPDDGPHARAHRAAALEAARTYREAIAAGVPGDVDGLLRLDARASAADMRAELAMCGLPSDYVDVRDDAIDDTPAWWYPRGGWITPPSLVRWALERSAIAFVGGAVAARLEPSPDGRWRVLAADDAVLAEADAVVLAGGSQQDALLASLPPGLAEPLPPLAALRGQVTRVAAGTPGLVAPDVPRAGGGYALALPGGDVLCGATSTRDDPDPAVRDADHRHNLAQLAAVTGSALHEDLSTLLAEARLSGRVGWRATSADRLPWVGAVPAAVTAKAPDQPRLWPRVPGLFVIGAFGSRGLTWAPLAGRLLASWATDAPFPVEADLVAALDPARGPVKARR